MCEVLFFILLISVAGFLIYLANKDGKSESCSEKPENSLGKKLNEMINECSYGYMYTFKNFEVILNSYFGQLEVLDTLTGDVGILNSSHSTYASNSRLDKMLEDYYVGKSRRDRLGSFIEDLVTQGVLTKTWNEQLREKLGVYVKYRSWAEIGNCEYFTNSFFGVYRFSDWKYLGAKAALKAIEGLPIKPCEDPKKTHWKHFLELEMKAKKQREIDCRAFVESILNKQKEYNDLQFKYEMLPSAPITDFESFTNFCKTVHTDVSFEDYEISNMLLLMKANLSN